MRFPFTALVAALWLAAPAMAQTTARMEFAPAGTTLNWSIVENGATTQRTNRVVGRDGPWPAIVRGTETQQRIWAAPGCWSCEGMDFDRDAYMRLWPLAVGKSVTIVRTSRAQPERRWEDTIRVVRSEQVTVPAGRFQAFVIETSSRGLHNNWTGTQTLWWAPAVGWVVQTTQRASDNYSYRAELAAFQRP